MPPRAAPDAKTKKYIVSLVFRDKIIRYFNCFQNCPTLIKPRSEAVASIAGLCSTLGHKNIQHTVRYTELSGPL
jgi:hypothetical protein